MARSIFQYCPMCGAKAMQWGCPHGDGHKRQLCSQCGYIYYENPTPVVGTICLWEGKVLLCRRAIEPRKGYWTLPAGFMELGETVSDGARRETWEEAGVDVTMGQLFSMIDVPRSGHIHFFFLAELNHLNWHPGPETLEQRLFSEEEIPWDEISFTTVKTTLEKFFEDRRNGRFSLHTYALT